MLGGELCQSETPKKGNIVNESNTFLIKDRALTGPNASAVYCVKMVIKASYHRVARLMADGGLYSTLRCRHPKSLTDSRLARQGDYPNLVKHQSFKPFEALSSDITQTTTSEGKAYICQ